MDEPIGPVRVREARELLAEPVTMEPASIYQRCSGCGALVQRTSGPERAHRKFHDALAVMAARVFGRESGS